MLVESSVWMVVASWGDSLLVLVPLFLVGGINRTDELCKIARAEPTGCIYTLQPHGDPLHPSCFLGNWSGDPAALCYVCE